MFGLGWSEMLVVGIVALIVIGPKDLPGLFRTMGEFTGKARGMAREFSRAMNAAADESGVNDISKTLKAASNPTKFGTDKLKEATGMSKGAATKGPATQALSEERQAMKEKMSDAMGKAAEDRMAREAADKAAAEAAPKAAKDDV
ncbi:Sec-independent protein translocase protein TatB [Yoonia sediminilitoris]|uniref:Sec-independent protein translocase protein TatB n=1 Tax=Yoonia sediminilitoris TaxID=1286148 RepID=A0A2T6KE17_9RHOB|nr:Sec-independent protein translocase protein TatB [Yoonia sediminilitoris]PUB13263.1 sec-independent protein translocase protein TatB [Yoonia sediminilitoris]RCW94598.1 sec-independent protein translocase protein TatB [Yoonia sediminilitoris]